MDPTHAMPDYPAVTVSNLWLSLGVVVLVGGCVTGDGDSPPAGTDATGAAEDGSDAGTTGGLPTTASGELSTGSAASTGGTEVTGTGGSGAVDTSTGASADTSTGGDGSGESTGSVPGGAYDPCELDEQCGPGLQCWDVANYCTPACDSDAMKCPLPSTGDAMGNCVKTSRGALCRLPCSPDTTTCPDGMFCNAMLPGPPPACEFP